MIQLGGAIHQPYLVLLGVEAQRFEVRSHMDGSTFFYCLYYYSRAEIIKQLRPPRIRELEYEKSKNYTLCVNAGIGSGICLMHKLNLQRTYH